MKNIAEMSTLQYDGEITIATGSSRHTAEWKNKTLLWSKMVERLSRTNRTGETIAEYLSMPKSRQDEIKDVGGFVGGDGGWVDAGVDLSVVGFR